MSAPACAPDKDAVAPNVANEKAVLRNIAQLLKPNIVDLFNFATASKAIFQAVAPDWLLWREVYLANEPLTPKDFRKRLLKDSYCDQQQLLTIAGGLQLSVWMRTCCLLFRKPRLVLVLGGRDPILVRRLGQAEAALQRVHLGINYHLDSYLDEDESRFAVEFPQLFQDLDAGDIVVTQDYRGAGCWTVFPPGTPPPKPPPRTALHSLLPNPPWKLSEPRADPNATPAAGSVPSADGAATSATGGSTIAPVSSCSSTNATRLAGEGWPVLRKNEYDSSGYGILTAAVAPPTYPLFYYCEEPLSGMRGGPLDRVRLATKQVYWFGYSRLKDGALFSWGDLQICEDA